jgi:hypothetical protein
VTPPSDSPAPAAQQGEAAKPKKPKALPKLTTDALTGKSPLGSFAELEAFFKTKDEPAKPATPPEPPAAEVPPPSPPAEPPAERPAPTPE